MDAHADASITSLEHRRIRDPRLAGMALAALGIVFGDIGTSPLYTLKTVLDLAGDRSTDGALGLLSLITWTLIIITSVKYVAFVMRVDNDGEGGIMALMSLLGVKNKQRPLIVIVGLFGAALIYGDGAITPAISVLSALEGLELAAPAISHWVLPLSVVILLALFLVQPLGTAKIGRVFGPVMLLWFVVIGVLGLWGVLQHPGVLIGFNPWLGLHFLFTGGWAGFLVLGGVFLCVTGAEALYADMGHFGAFPIRIAWYAVVLPALLLNYAGQTALLVDGLQPDGNIFYHLCPAPLLLPLIVLSTVATIIASQSIITGAFSMTRQAIQLGWCPRLHIKQTSSEGYGQIYVGVVNWLLMVITVGITIAFGASDNLAAAYGIAVSLTMLLTTALLYVAMREIWKWKLLPASLVAGAFFIIDAAFFVANATKFLEGGWVPLLLAAIVYGLMTIWHRGAVAVTRAVNAQAPPVSQFLAEIAARGIPRVPGTAVFLTKAPEDTPPLMLWQVKNNRALHQTVVALTMMTESVPWIDNNKRLRFQEMAPGFWRLRARFGFMERPNIPLVLHQAQARGCGVDLSDVVYYVGHETVRHKITGGLPQWQEKIFAFMMRNSAHVTDFCALPNEGVVEIGRVVEI